ncbi:hypothetical protein NM208_g5193 [Fusarium decemcellulare]|uniref:Uncharacterized protein n=1 Tax=Fusarium decemcellulare TaxID=57161 RepID=A0ACC1SHW8_9HYPO|nr:hypothetical protein NM208_g5193 [Fusarium decemcellulare]
MFALLTRVFICEIAVYTMRLLLILLALATFATPFWNTDCNFTGGFAIRSPGGCADDTIDCGGGVVPRCCPAGFYCLTSTDNAYCCPIEADCLSDILNVPKCPHREWTLWTQENALIEDAWCCNDNWFGVVRMQGRAVACSPLASAISPRETPAIRLKDPESTCTTRSSLTATVLAFTTSPKERGGVGGPDIAPPATTDTIFPGATNTTPTETVNTTPSQTTDTSHSRTSSTALLESPDPVEEGNSDVSLDIGTVTGIIVGSIGGGAAIVVVAFWILQRRQRQDNVGMNMENGIQEERHCPEREVTSIPVPELPAKEPQRVELEG